MSAHPTPQAMAAFRQGGLEPDELVTVGNHIAGCPECSAAAIRGAQLEPGLQAWSRAVRSPLETAHLEEAEIRGLVEGTLEPETRKLAEAHLRGCAPCAEDVRDLRAFREELREPAAAGAGSRERRRLIPPWLTVLRNPGWAIAGTAAIVTVIGGWYAIQPLTHALEQAQEQVRGLQTQLLAAQRTQVELQEQANQGKALQESLDQQARDLRRLKAQDTELRRRLAAAATGTPGIGPLETLAKPQELASLRGSSSPLMGGPTQADRLAVRGPVGTLVRSDRPAFSWSPEPNATSYRVQVYDDQFRRVARGEVSTGTQWTPEKPLPRGKQYRWEVTALKAEAELAHAPAPTAAPALFRVMDQAQSDAVGERSALGMLHLATTHASAGLLDEAERELEAALQEAAQSETRQRIQRTLAEVRSWRGRGAPSTGLSGSPTSTKPAQK